MSIEKQVTITPEDTRVELMFDFDELALLMNDFKEGFKNTVEMVEDEPSGFGGNSTRPGYDWLDDDETFSTAGRDYDYYRNNKLWGRIADELDIDMDDDDFNDEQLSKMYSFAYDQNEEYENPKFDDVVLDFPDYVVDDDNNSETPGVAPTMDLTYQNRYTDQQKAKKHAFGGARYKIGESMSLNFEELQSNYSPLPSSSGNPEDSNFNGKTNSLYT